METVMVAVLLYHKDRNMIACCCLFYDVVKNTWLQNWKQKYWMCEIIQI